MDNVCVLMSTYNGEKYLNEQIDSLLNQKGVKVSIFVRDDGSTDETISILEKYKNDGVLDWYQGANLKSARSFLDLVYNAPQSDYYAFCDQDDYWLPDKLSVAVSCLKSTDPNRSALYCCKTVIVDKELKPIEQNNKYDFIALDMPSVFMFNNAPGCTMVFNRYLLDRVKEYNPSFIGMHDAWIYKVCVVTGNQVIVDKNAHILYRQHENNVLGGIHDPVATWRRRLKYLKSAPCARSKIAREVLIGYRNSMSSRDIEILSVVSNYKTNYKYWLKMIFNPTFSTPIPYYTLLFKISALLRVF